MKVSGNLPPRLFMTQPQIRTGIRRNLNEQFSRVLSHDLHWENRTYELKRTFARQVVSNVARVKQLSVTKMSPSFGGLRLIQSSSTHVNPDQEAGSQINQLLLSITTL